LYGLTEPGHHLISYMKGSSQRFSSADFTTPDQRVFVPKSRASHVRRCLQFLAAAKGEAPLREALKDWSVDVDTLEDDSWLAVDVLDEFLELVEAKFGDGSYDFIRALYAQAIGQLPTVREQLSKAIPLEALAERAPIVWNKEWNFGRLEVETRSREAIFRHHDLLPTAGICAMLQGAYEGILRARKTPGRVVKTLCIRKGGPWCEYQVRW
jgi:hypothetical protein